MIALVAVAMAGVGLSLNEGLVVEDADSGATLAAHLLFEQQLTIDPITGQASLALQRLRPDLHLGFGSIPVRARVQTELAGDVRLLDAYVDLGSKEAFVRIGHALVPTGRAQMTPIPKLQFQGFAASTTTVQAGRELGVQGHAQAGPVLAQGGVFTMRSDGDAPWHAVARTVFDIAGGVPYDETSALDGQAEPGVALGTSAQWSSVDEVGTLAGEIAAQVGRVRVQAEGFMTTNDRRGVYGQVTCTLWPERVDIAARIDHLASKTDVREGAETMASVYFAGPHLRVQTGYRLDWGGMGEVAQRVILNGQLWL